MENSFRGLPFRLGETRLLIPMSGCTPICGVRAPVILSCTFDLVQTVLTYLPRCFNIEYMWSKRQETVNTHVHNLTPRQQNLLVNKAITSSCAIGGGFFSDVSSSNVCTVSNTSSSCVTRSKSCSVSVSVRIRTFFPFDFKDSRCFASTAAELWNRWVPPTCT